METWQLSQPRGIQCEAVRRLDRPCQRYTHLRSNAASDSADVETRSWLYHRLTSMYSPLTDVKRGRRERKGMPKIRCHGEWRHS